MLNLQRNQLNPHTYFRETPHSGYHWQGHKRRFFEGWYFRVTLPKIQENFAFMYSIDDPFGNQKHSGGAVQILGIDEAYLWRTFPNVAQFWSARNYLALTHWRKSSFSDKPTLLNTNEFNHYIQEGYQATLYFNQGLITNPSNHQYCRWQYTVKPIYGWGDSHKFPKSTAGLFSFFPIFEPGWQILMAYGLATGEIDWNGTIYPFENATAYSEKNWGHSFPEKWFWLNCNYFSNAKDLAITAAGGKRKVLKWNEEVAMIGIHYQGKFYDFSPWNSLIEAEIQPWGEWKMEAYNDQFMVKLIGITHLAGTQVRIPTENGLVFACRDTLKGHLTLELRQRNRSIIVQAKSHLCGLEIGGSPWDKSWKIYHSS